MAQIAAPRFSKERSTTDIPIQQKPTLHLPESGRIERESEVIVAEEPLINEYAAALAFAEEPVMIRIERSGEKFAPRVIDCWANGIGAEIFHNGRWVAYGFLPVGVPVITRRKYVEVLARSKLDTIETRTGTTFEEHPANDIDVTTSSRAPFSVLEDRNPKGVEWLQRVVGSNW